MPARNAAVQRWRAQARQSRAMKPTRIDPRHHGLQRRTLVLALAASLAACGKRQVPRAQALAAGSVVLALGDSLTHGTGAAPQASYPAQLAALSGWNVVNAGVPGDTAAQALARLPALLAEHKPAWVIVSAGGNDFLRRLPKAQAAENVRAMVRLAKERGIGVLLIGTPDIGFMLTPPDFFAEIAKQSGVPYEGDVLTKIFRDTSLKADQVHPNALGYRLMAERVAELLRKSGAI